jgi:PAS domain S-box-containing protein
MPATPAATFDELLDRLEQQRDPGDLRRVVQEIRDDLRRRQPDASALKMPAEQAAFDVELSSVGLWELDVASGVVAWDERAAVIVGCRPGKGVNEHWSFLRFVHPEDSSLVAEGFNSVRRTGQAFGLRHRIVRPDGEIRFVRTHASRFIGQGKDGADRLVGTMVDLSDRANPGTPIDLAPQAHTLGDDLRMILDQLPVGVMVTDATGNAVIMNRALNDLWRGQRALESFEQYEQYRAFRSGSTEPLTPDEWPITRALTTGEPCGPIELTIERFDGSRATMLSSAVPMHDRQGRVVRAVAIAQDITERAGVIRALAESRRKLETALIAGEVGSFEWDIHTDRLWGDPNFQRIFNIQLDETGSAPLASYLAAIHPDDVDEVRRRIGHTLHTGADYEAEYRIVNNGRERWVVARGKVDRDAHGTALRFPGIVLDITDRKLAENALRESNALLRAISDSTGDVIYAKDRQGRLRYANPATLALLGLPAERALGRTDAENLADPDVARQIMANDRRIMEGGVGEELHEVVPLPSGELRIWASLKMPDRDPSGQVVGLLGVSRDITDRQRAEVQLRQRTEQLAEAQRLARLGSWTCSSDCKLVTISSEAAHLLGLEPSGKLPASLEEFALIFKGPDRDLLLSAIQASRSTGKPFELDVELATQGERRGWVTVRGKVDRDAQRSVLGMHGTVQDISDRKRAEHAIRENEERLRISEERFRVALSNAPASVYANDADLRYTWIYNARFGFDPPAMLGKSDDELLPPESVADLIALKRRVLQTGRGARERIQCRIDGEDLAFDVTVEPQRDAAGEVAGLIVATFDVTDLYRARREAEAANSAKDQFLAVLSHELRTPLTPVLAAAQMLEADMGLSADRRDLAQVIRRNVELEARLIDDLLDLTRIARNKLELHLAEVSIHDKVRHVARMCGDEFAAKKLNVRLRLNAVRYHAMADAARLQQIVWNLLKNAIKFTPTGGKITITTADECDRLKLVVEDTGVGIDPAMLPRIFDAFEQGGRDVTRQFGGLGLGLAITKALLEMHQGEIAASSPGRGGGATFTVYLPTIAAPALAQTASGTVPEAAPPATHTVLLLDDHEDTRRIIAMLLKAIGCVVCDAATVADALALAQRQSFDLLISDIGLPDGSGVDVMRQLRADYGMRGIALSGYGMEDDLARSRDAGFETHLTKPIDLHALESAVRRLLK